MKKKRKYIYLEKCLIIRILQIYIFSFYDFLFFISLSDAELLYYILCAYKFYGYQEDPDILLRIGKENKQYRKLLKELGASPKKLLWIEKW